MIECIICKKNNTTSQDVFFYRFPKNKKLLKLWIYNMGKEENWRPKQDQYLCSNHFSDDCFIGNRKRKDSVPTVFEDVDSFINNHTPISEETIWQNENDTVGSIVSYDLDSSYSVNICRICLATNVKMYNTSEHRLNYLYERVTGMEITCEDKLPKKLCWECVARLLSANNFREKALKTHNILCNKIYCEKVENDTDFINKVKNMSDKQYDSISSDSDSMRVTEKDFESVDRKQNQLISTLGSKFYKDNDYYQHIVESYNDGTDETNVTNINNIVNANNYYETNAICYDKDATEERTLHKEVFTEMQEIMTNTNNSEDLLLSNNNNIETQCDNPVTNVNIHNRILSNEIKQENMTNENDMLQIKNEIDDIFDSMHIDCNVKEENMFDGDFFYESATENNTQSRSLEPNNLNETINQTSKTKNNIAASKNGKTLPNPMFKDLTVVLEDIAVSELADVGPKPINRRNSHRHIKVTKSSFQQRRGKIKKAAKKLFKCDICAKIMNCKSILTKHIKDHFNFNCRWCSHRADTEENVIKHIKANHKSEMTWQECFCCSYKTYCTSFLAKHIKDRHTKTIVLNGTEIIIYRCPYCNYISYNNLNYLISHFNFLHVKKNNFKCSLCTYETPNTEELECHQNRNHAKSLDYKLQNTESDMLKCSFCWYKTKFKSALAIHVNAKHIHTYFYKCQICNFKSFYYSSVSNHTKLVHNIADRSIFKQYI